MHMQDTPPRPVQTTPGGMAQGELPGFPLCSVQGSVNFSPEHSLPESIYFTPHYTRCQAQAEQAGHSHQLPPVTAAGAALLTCKLSQLSDITGLRDELLPLPNKSRPLDPGPKWTNPGSRVSNGRFACYHSCLCRFTYTNPD